MIFDMGMMSMIFDMGMIMMTFDMGMIMMIFDMGMIMMIFDMGIKLMMLLMMMIPLPEQQCHQPNVLPPKHTRSEMKQSVVLPPPLTV